MEWISTKDKLPPYGVNVIVIYRGVTQRLSYYIDGGDDEPDWWQDCLDEFDPVDINAFSHWMPLPEPPKPE
ncbi:MAG: DUF551 domain-containing protein [Plesiomonas sp.]